MRRWAITGAGTGRERSFDFSHGDELVNLYTRQKGDVLKRGAVIDAVVKLADDDFPILGHTKVSQASTNARGHAAQSVLFLFDLREAIDIRQAGHWIRLLPPR